MTPRQWHALTVQRSAFVTAAWTALLLGAALRWWTFALLAVVNAVLFIASAPPKDES